MDKLFDQSMFLSKSSMSNDVISIGRPKGGVAIIWKSNLKYKVSNIETVSERLIICKIENETTKLMIFNVYMPCNTDSNNLEFTNIIYEIILDMIYDMI